MKLFRRLICLVRGHNPKYYLIKNSNRHGGEVWGVKCKRCKCELKTDWRGSFWE